MKTVHSQVLSSAPISLSDATSFLSAYNASVCGGVGHAFIGASPETCSFVRRALASFQEVEQLHRKLNDRSSDCKPTSETHDDAKTTVGDNPSQSFAASRDVTSKPRSSSHLHDDVISRRVEIVEQSVGGQIGEIDMVNKEKKKKKKKKRDNVDENPGEIKEEEVGESEMVNGEVKKEEKKKKKKKKRDIVDENRGEIKEEEEVGQIKMGSEEGKTEEKKKKTKSEVLESGEVDASEEQREKRKKKGKSEVLESSKVDASEEQQEKRKKKRKSEVLESSKVDASEEQQEKRKKRRKS